MMLRPSPVSDCTPDAADVAARTDDVESTVA